MKNILVCIDDTDNIDSRGTGELAAILADTIEEKCWGKSTPITRHQLLIHPDIEYTSHNSSMCFEADIEPQHFADITRFSMDFLLKESAEGSDPGLCIVPLDTLKDKQELINFGRNAKKIVLSKETAYDLAKKLDIHLSEHGGTGIGVIGALAGTGLRLSGNDGRFRGHFKIDPQSDSVSVEQIKKQTHVKCVKSLDGELLSDDEQIRLGNKVKSVLLKNRSTLMVFKNLEEPEVWQTCTKQQLKNY
jgi:hypothetical protein